MFGVGTQTMGSRDPNPGICACDSGYAQAACCTPYIAGLAPAPTALALMRSRYTAYTQSNADYLRHTWHASTRPAMLDLEPGRRWLGLKILGTSNGEAGDTSGTVEFVARFKIGGRAHRLHENSRFVSEGGRWFYVDGDIG